MLPSISVRFSQSAATRSTPSRAVVAGRLASWLVALDGALANTRAEYHALSSLVFPVILRYRSTHHVRLRAVIIASMSDCICHESDKSTRPREYSVAVAHTYRFRRASTCIPAVCSTSFGLRVIIAMLGCPLVLRRPLQGCRGKHRQRQFVQPRQCGYTGMYCVCVLLLLL